MGSIINPPNTPLLNSRGLLTPEWYRFFVSIQKDVEDVEGSVEAETLLAGGALAGILGVDATDGDIWASPQIERENPDVLTPPHVDPIYLDETLGVVEQIGAESFVKRAPAALTKADDTNVTLTLGGTPTTALLRAVSLTLGWTGQLSVARGGTGNAGTAWTAYSPTVASSSGSFGTVSTSAAYMTLGKTVFLSVVISITANGTAAGLITVTLPFNAVRRAAFAAAEPALSGCALFAVTTSGLNQIIVAKYDSTYAGGTGATIAINGVYEMA